MYFAEIVGILKEVFIEVVYKIPSWINNIISKRIQLLCNSWTNEGDCTSNDPIMMDLNMGEKLSGELIMRDSHGEFRFMISTRRNNFFTKLQLLFCKKASFTAFHIRNGKWITLGYLSIHIKQVENELSSPTIIMKFDKYLIQHSKQEKYSLFLNTPNHV